MSLWTRLRLLFVRHARTRTLPAGERCLDAHFPASGEHLYICDLPAGHEPPHLSGYGKGAIWI